MMERTLRRALTLALSVTTAGTLLAACSGSQPATGSQSAGGSAAPAADKPLRVLQAFSPSTFNQNVDPTRAMIRIDAQVLDTATRYVGTGEDLKLEPWLATEWKQTDPNTWRFKVRPNVKFTNGEALTAEAFKSTLDSVLGKKDGKVRSHYTNLSIKVVDDLTFDVVTRDKNDGSVPAQLSALYILPPKYLAEVGPEKFGQQPIGTGAYKVSEFVPGSKVTLTANSDFWGATKPSIPTITVEGVADPSTRVSQLMSGSADLIDGVPGDLLSRLQDATSVEVRKTPTVERTFVLINAKTGPTADVNVRKAINMAIDRDSIVKLIMGGNAVANQGLWVPLEGGYQENFAPFPYNPDEARKLVDAAGPAAKGKLMLYYSTEYPNYAKLAQAIQSQLQAIGLTVELESGTSAPLLAKLKESKDGGLALWNFGPGYIDSSYQMHIYFVKGSGYGVLAGNDELTALATQAQATSDPAGRAELYTKIQQNAIADNAFEAPLFRNVDMWGASKSLNWKPSATGDYNFATTKFSG